MSVVIACPACGQKHSAGPELAGKAIRCRACGDGIRVPAKATGPAKVTTHVRPSPDGFAAVAVVSAPAPLRPVSANAPGWMPTGWSNVTVIDFTMLR